MEKTVHTVGTSTRSLEAFLAILRVYGVRTVVDVRRYPVSRLPHFRSADLEWALRDQGISYVWLGESLGGRRKGGYGAYMETPEFAAGLATLEHVAGQAETAIICAEALPWKCHRLHIARRLEERGWRVSHIIDEKRVWTPGEP